jgi:uracil-DNA glycosylase
MNNLYQYITEPGWREALNNEFHKPYFSKLEEFVNLERQKTTVFPPEKEVFAAFNATPFDNVKVVILGQDPYHGEGQSHGLCFSVRDGIRKPPSLLNIFKELKSDLEIPIPEQGNLLKWCAQGVLLLNATLTVRALEAGSHQKHGWETFTDAAITLLSEQRSGIVFLLWGAYAQAKERLIDTEKHFVLKAVHPSPLSAQRGFFGCKQFSKTNEILKSIKKEPIDWTLDCMPTLF